MRRLLIAMGIVIVVGVLAVRFGSGMVAEKAAHRYFAEKNIPVKTLRIGHASMRDARLEEAVLGKDDALHIEGASINYSYRDEKVNFTRIMVDRVRARMRIADGKWDMGGLEAMAALATLGDAKPKGALTVTFDTALEATVQGKNITALSRRGTLELTQDGNTLNALNIALEVKSAEGEDTYAWAVKTDGVVLTHKGNKVTTPLTFTATGTASETTIEGQGTLMDKGKTMPLILHFTHSMKTQKTSVQWTSNTIKLTEASKGFAAFSPLLAGMPALNASLRMEGDVRLAPNAKPKLRHRFIIERAALSPLLKLVFKDDVAITGDMTGVIPLRWTGEKVPQVVGASLKNLASGTLIYDPLTGASSALEGQDQAGILLEALRRFEYKTLDIDATSDGNGVLTSTFHLIGGNPDLYDGKTIDFTLNVNGNLLSILESQAKVNDVITKSRK